MTTQAKCFRGIFQITPVSENIIFIILCPYAGCNGKNDLAFAGIGNAGDNGRNIFRFVIVCAGKKSSIGTDNACKPVCNVYPTAGNALK